MNYPYCPACDKGPEQNAHNGQGVYCSRVPQTLKRKPSLIRRVLRFISGRDDDYLYPLKDAEGFVIGSVSLSESINGIRLEGTLNDPKWIEEIKKSRIAAFSIWGVANKEKN